MKYLSSRGGESGLSFEQVLFSGYAKDGGLYFPESIPVLSPQMLTNWASLSYPDIVRAVMKLYIAHSEIPADDLDKLVEKAFSVFKNPDSPIQIARLKDNLNIAELFHGPTLAFKDLALCVVGQLYDYFLARREEHMTVLIGTSGDTGSAAINAVKNLEWIDVIVLLPKGRCTEIQELQMTTVLSDNVHNFAVEGTSDDLDVPIKAVFADPEYVDKHKLCSINSINWARILVQISHYIFCYLQLAEEIGDPVQLIVPTGACGNIAAGYVAHEMGVPVQLVAAVTPNDIVHRTLHTGDFSLSESVLRTWATAMDIQVPYNVERIVLMACNLDTASVGDLMRIFESTKQAKIPETILQQIRRVIVDSQVVDNQTMIDTVKQCHLDNNGYLLCPHTAVGVAYTNNNSKAIPQIVLATASADKFPEAVAEAGLSNTCNPDIEKLFTMETRFEWMREGDNWEEKLRQKIQFITRKYA